MQNQRPLLPRPKITEGTAKANEEHGAGKQRRHRHTAQKWEDLKEYFKKLYYQEDNTLEDVRRQMREQHGFEASERQYKIKIKEWHLVKNVKATDMQILLAKRDRRKHDRDVSTVFLVRDMKLDDTRLERFAKREHTNTDHYVSPSTATPAGVTYYTPQSTIDWESPSSKSDDIFILLNDHHYKSIRPMTTTKVTCERIECSTNESLASTKHSHQVAEQGIICRGRFAHDDQATEFLWQARNLAINLKEVLLTAETCHSPSQLQKASAMSAPQFWASPQAPEGLDTDRIRRLVDYIRPDKLCQNLFGLESHDVSRWTSGWQAMNGNVAAIVENVGQLSFGDPSLPYPEMEIFTLWVKFDNANSTKNSSLLRICICIDPDVGRRNCNYCHNTCLILDYMDPNGAAKINVPLFRSSQRISDCAQFRKDFHTSTDAVDSTWNWANYLYHGMSYLEGCADHKMTKNHTRVHLIGEAHERETGEEIWMGPDEMSDENFEPFPSTEIQTICPEHHMLASNLRAWDSETSSLVSDEDGFDPFPAY